LTPGGISVRYWFVDRGQADSDWVDKGCPSRFSGVDSMTKYAFLAAAAVAFSAAPVLAGGGSSGNIPVRIKNVGSLPVGVSAMSGSVSPEQLLAAARVVAANGVTQFPVRAGAFTAAAADPNAPEVTNRIRTDFNTRTFKTIYLQAQQDTTAATLVGAPGGVKF
jgi:hypothetical protein